MSERSAASIELTEQSLHRTSSSESGPDALGGAQPPTSDTSKISCGWFDARRGDGDPTRVHNPFHGREKDQIERVALRISKVYSLERHELTFKKAARSLAEEYNGREAWNGRDLTQDEITALKNEKTAKFWDLPLPLRTTYLLLFVAAVVQGWNQTATNGANLTWPTDLGLVSSTLPSCTPDRQHTWAFASVNAAPYLAAGVGCWSSDLLVNRFRFGRRGAILASASLILIAAIWGSLTRTWKQLLGARVMLGLGMGCKAAVVPVFAAEIAPAHLRGLLTMNWQVFDALGIFLGFAANLIASTAASSVWRWQLASSAIPAFALLCGLAYVWLDSPRFLMKHEEKYRLDYDKRLRHWKKRKDDYTSRSRQRACSTAHPGDKVETMGSWFRAKHWLLSTFERVRRSPDLPYQSPAFRTLTLLRGHPIIAAKELIYAHAQLLVETLPPDAEHNAEMNFSLKSTLGWRQRFKQLWTEKYIRREVIAAAVVMLSQQACGINVLIFFSSTIFCSAGSGPSSSDSRSVLGLSMVIGLINFVFALRAYDWIETKGRRWLLLTFLPVLFILMIIAASSFYYPTISSKRGVVVTFTCLFTAFYSFGLGPVPFTLSAEMFPLEHRMVGMSLAVSINFIGAGLLTLGVPWGTPGPLLFTFASLNLLAFIAIWLFVREVVEPQGPLQDASTISAQKGPLSLEELFYIFDLTTREHITYQWTVLCWWLRHKSGIGELPEEPPGFRIWAEERRKPQQQAAGSSNGPSS